MSRFKKATRTQGKLRMAIAGPAKSGKTYTALSIAKHLGKRIAVIDSERGSASLYAGDAADFDVLELERFSPRDYIDAINEAEREGYDVIVVDSISHAWAGAGGALEMVENAKKRSQSSNGFAAWKEVTPEYNRLIDTMLRSPAHIIVTMRVKTAYELEEDERGRKKPVKLGLAPIMRSEFEYEFTVVADINLDHDLVITQTRCKALDKAVFRCAGEDVAGILKAWLSDGAPAPAPAPAKVNSKADAACAAIKAAQALDRLQALEERVKAVWESFTEDEQERVTQAITEAYERFEPQAAAAGGE